MLLKFKFKNYRSFAEEQVLDMEAAAIHEHDGSLFDINGKRVLPVMALFGANASGKSNLFLAFSAMCTDVLGRHEVGKSEHIIPFRFDPVLKRKPTVFEVCITDGKKRYRYGFSRDQRQIHEEWLFQQKYGKGSRSVEKQIFYRNLREVSCDSVSKAEQEEIRLVFGMIGQSELLMTALGQSSRSAFAIVYRWFERNVFIHQDAVQMLYRNGELLTELNDFMREVDPDIHKILVRKTRDECLREVYDVYVAREASDGTVDELKLEKEARGLQKVFRLAIWLILSCRHGRVLFIDDIDEALHPLLLLRIIKMYRETGQNAGQGQLIFSANNLACLDFAQLRRDEILLVEKNNLHSQLRPLYDGSADADNTPVRVDMNFAKNYMSGRFGAVPFVRRLVEYK